MNMRHIFCGLLILAVCLFSGPVRAESVIKLATIAPEGTGLLTAIRNAAKETETKTGGRIKFKIYPGGVMGNDAVILRKMRSGQLQAATFSAGGMAKVYRDFNILGLPFLFKDHAQVDAARARFEPRLIQGLEREGFVNTGIIEAGFVYMMSAARPIAAPADLKGLKVWIPEGDPVGQAVFDASGVPPVPLPIPDVLTALQTNLLDTIASSPVAALALQWFTRVKYLTDVPLLYSYGTLAFHADAWKGVSEADKTVVRETFVRHIHEVDRKYRQDNENGMATLKKQGIVPVPVNAAGLAEMHKIADAAMASLVRQKLYDEAFLNEVRAFSAGKTK